MAAPLVGPQTTTNLSNSQRTQYLSEYVESAMRRRIYHQMVRPITERSSAAQQADNMAEMSRTATVQVDFLGDMEIRLLPVDQNQDMVPQALRDAKTTVSVDMYQDAIQWSKKTPLQSYTDYLGGAYKKVALNMMENVENLIINQALTGGLVHRVASTRAAVDAGTAGHRASNDLFWYVQARLQNFNTPGFGTGPDGMSMTPAWACITDPFVAHDIATTGDVVNVAQYQKGSIILNQEIGQIGPFKIISAGQAKKFYGAGAANTSDADTTLAANADALATTITVASATNIAVGDWLNILTAQESGNTFYPENERVKVTSVNSTTIGVAGEGDNGGLRFNHLAGAIVNKDDTVHTMLFGGPESLVEVYAPSIGRFGMPIGPLQQGVNNMWESLGWAYYGGFGRIAEKHLYRAEVSVEEEA